MYLKYLEGNQEFISSITYFTMELSKPSFGLSHTYLEIKTDCSLAEAHSLERPRPKLHGILLPKLNNIREPKKKGTLKIK